MASPRGLLAGALSLLGLALPAGRAAAATLDEARASEFFRWFHLEEAESGRDPRGAETRLFRPQDEKFRQLAAVELTLGERGRIGQARLVLARSFIEDSWNSSFARDIAKSFLLFAAPPADAPALKDLVDEIQLRDLRGPILMRTGPPEVPAEPSAAYRAFAGELPEARLALPGAEISFLNRGSRNGGELVIAATPRTP